MNTCVLHLQQVGAILESCCDMNAPGPIWLVSGEQILLCPSSIVLLQATHNHFGSMCLCRFAL